MASHKKEIPNPNDMVCTSCGEFCMPYNDEGIKAFDAHEASKHPKGAFYRLVLNKKRVKPVRR